MRSTTQRAPLITLLLPVYNEAALLRPNLLDVLQHLETVSNRYRFEVLVVNDGSRDDSGDIAESMARDHPSIRVVHHARNGGLGKALRTGFSHAQGDYIVVLDIDLSYGPEHIERMLDKLREEQAQIVLASPYGKGGSVANVPPVRLFLSRWANRFLNLFAPGHLSTWTCMVRAYDTAFIRGMHLRGVGMEIMPEIIRKAMILRAKIAEVPAQLDWEKQNALKGKRRSSMRVFGQIFGTVLSGFILRPFSFLILPSFAVLAFAAFAGYFMLVHFFAAYAELLRLHQYVDPTYALRIAYKENPHTYIVGLLSLVLGIQLFGLGLVALQAKSYFDDLFHLASSVYGKVSQLEARLTEREPGGRGGDHG